LRFFNYAADETSTPTVVTVENCDSIVLLLNKVRVCSKENNFMKPTFSAPRIALPFVPGAKIHGDFPVASSCAATPETASP